MTLSLGGCLHCSPRNHHLTSFVSPTSSLPPVFTEWLQAPVIATAKRPHPPHKPTNRFPPPPPLCWVIRGPRAQHKNTAARLSTRSKGQSGAPTDSYSEPVNDIIEIPVPAACMCGGNNLTPVLLVCLRRQDRWGGEPEECVDPPSNQLLCLSGLQNRPCVLLLISMFLLMLSRKH